MVRIKMATKEELEKHFSRVLQRSISGCPQGEIVVKDKHDCRIQTTDGELGIEVTFIFQDAKPGESPPQLQDAEHSLVASHAQTMAEKRKLPPVMVDLFFNENQILSK